MSSYLISNERAPLAIGLFLAVAVVVGLCMFMLAVDESLFTAGKPKLSSTINQQARELATLREEAAIQSKKAERLENLSASLKTLQLGNLDRSKKIKSLTDELTAATRERMQTTGEFQAYKERYRDEIRGKAKGKTIERMVTKSGTVYENITIRQVTPIGMLIRHDSGSKRIPFEELPADLQDLYQFDPEEKDAALAQEKSMHRSHEESVARSNAENSIASRNTQSDSERQRIQTALTTKQARIGSLHGEISSLQRSISSEEAKLRRAESDSRIGGISRAPDMKIKLAKKQEELSQLNQQVAILQARLQALK